MNVRTLPQLVLSGAVSIFAITLSAPLHAQVDPSTGQPATSQSGLQQQNPSSAVHPSSSTHPNSMQDQTSGPDSNAQNMKDKIFLRKAAEGGMAEIQLGQLAGQKAGSDDVKSFGQKMVTDHTQLNQEMQPFADQLGVHAPKKLSAKDQAEYDKLNALSGDDFDKEYLAYTVRDHHQDLREFRMEAESTSDPALKAAVDKGAMTIRQHTGMVTQLARSKGVAIPGRAGAPVSSPAPAQ